MTNAWEYRMESERELWKLAGRGGGIQGGLNALGSQGWELVTLAGDTFIFKRPVHVAQ